MSYNYIRMVTAESVGGQQAAGSASHAAPSPSKFYFYVMELFLS